jgi:hypothetical protein
MVIENEEDVRERIFEGLSEDSNLATDHVVSDPLDEHAHSPNDPGYEPPTEAESELKAGDEVPGPPPRLHREDPGATPNRITRGERVEGKGDWEAAGKEARGKEHSADGRPRSAEERLRANVPYSKCFLSGMGWG